MRHNEINRRARNRALVLASLAVALLLACNYI